MLGVLPPDGEAYAIATSIRYSPPDVVVKNSSLSSWRVADDVTDSSTVLRTVVHPPTADMATADGAADDPELFPAT